MADPEAIARRHNISPQALKELLQCISQSHVSTTGTLPLEELLGPARGDQAAPAPYSLAPMSLSPAPEGGTEPLALEPPRPDKARYQRLGLLGRGGMGEVYRVWDHELNRTVAMKVLQPELASQRAMAARFVEEAQIGAQLQHPNIVPVYEIGRLADGRLYFTMLEVQGRVLSTQIQALHQEEEEGQELEEAPSLRGLVAVFHRACEAMAHAHQRGVLHRDLKPSNIMLVEGGAVFVVDWGLAKVLSQEESPQALITHRSHSEVFKTRYGKVAGTPAYMPPEQARGELERVDKRSDVYALGGILHHILTGAAPQRSAQGALEALEQEPIHEGLRQICRKALALEPEGRYPDAGHLAEAIRAWLEGTQRRAMAREAMAQALELEQRAALLEGQAQESDRQGRALLASVVPWSDEEHKAPGWEKLRQGQRLEEEAERLMLQANERLREALRLAPDWPRAHARLAEHYAMNLRSAERRQKQADIRRHEFHLEQHTSALPAQHPTRRRMQAVLRGLGALTLLTDPPGARVTLRPYQEHRRRLIPGAARDLGRTPLRKLSLEPGSYLLSLEAPGREPVHYPVRIERQSHWGGVRPGDTEPTPIYLPRRGELGPEEVYIPAGWFQAGDDNHEDASFQRQRIWVDGFCMSRDHITHAGFLDFLNDLVRQGRLEEALLHIPRERSVLDPLSQQAPLYQQDEAGLFRLPPESPVGIWGLRRPVMMVDWFAAQAYSQWLALRSGQPWRLACELEWEKAARGVDGRLYPWGDACDPSWARMADSQEGFRLPCDVGAYPVDQSPYGVRDMGGNASCWCLDAFHSRATPPPLLQVPRIKAQKVNLQQDRCTRGGSWVTDAAFSRATSRFGHVPFITSVIISFRVARSFPVVSPDPAR